MKKLIIIAFLAVINLSAMAMITHDLQNTRTEEAESLLISKVLNELGIDSLKTKSDLIRTKMLPDDHTKTIVSIPVIAQETREQDSYSCILDAYILVVSTQTGKILQQYHEQAFWESDAIMLEDISIDIAPYQLNHNTRAFGIVSKYRGNSMPNPYDQETLSMFIPNGKSITKVLDKLIIKQFTGEYDTRCAGRFKNESSIVVVSPVQTNRYAQLIIKRKIIYSEAVPKGEDCDEKVVKRVNNVTILKFRNGLYTLLPNRNNDRTN